MSRSISRRHYADIYGPTTGDRLRLGDTGLILADPMSVIHQNGHSGTLAEVGRRSHLRRSIDCMGLPRDTSCAPQRRPSLTPSR